MGRLYCVVMTLTFLLLSGLRAASGGPYVAFSLRRAMLEAEAFGRSHPKLQSLGGITRVLGLVYDATNRDVILVGRVVEGQPEARLDDLVVALRARVLYDEWPEVSIEPTKESYDTRRQSVVYRGHIEGTPFGRDFVDCDVILKRYGMGELRAVTGLPSYKSLCLEDVKAEIARAGVTMTGFKWASGRDADKPIKELHGRGVQGKTDYRVKFWFNPRKPRRVTAFQGVFCIEEMRMGVESQLLGDTEAKAGSGGHVQGLEHPARVFAAGLTQHYEEVTAAYPQIQRLKSLFDLLAVAQAIRELEDRPDFGYFLRGYPVPMVDTPSDHDFTELCALVDRSDGMCHAVQISGGIAPRAAIDWLNDGDVTALLKIVLGSRPSPVALTWNPRELLKWEMPNAQDLGLPAAEKDDQAADSKPSGVQEDVGCTVVIQSVVLDRVGVRYESDLARFSGFGAASFQSQGTGGVDMRMEVSERLFSRRMEDKLKVFRRQLLDGRSSTDGLILPPTREKDSR